MGRLGGLDRLLAPLDRRRWLPPSWQNWLYHARSCARCSRSASALVECLEQAKATGDRAQRLGVAVEPPLDPGPLELEPSLGDRIVGRRYRRGGAEGHLGLGEVARTGGGHRRATPEARACSSAGRHSVGGRRRAPVRRAPPLRDRRRSRAPVRRPRVSSVERFLESLRPEVVEREQLGRHRHRSRRRPAGWRRRPSRAAPSAIGTRAPRRRNPEPPRVRR